MNIIIFVLCLYLGVFVHEMGHYIAGKSCKLTVSDFGVGMEHKILSFKKGNTNISLGILPFGGYTGFMPGRINFAQKTLINLAGIIFNLIAFVISFYVITNGKVIKGLNIIYKAIIEENMSSSISTY